MSPKSVTIPRRFCGPPDSANGGYTAGVLAQYLGGAAEVTLRRPPPVDRQLFIDEDDGRVVLRDGTELVAEAIPAAIDLAAIPPVALDVARTASETSHFLDVDTHPFPTCFVCGPLREPGDGLRLFSGRIPGRDDVFATPWTPADDDAVMVWAALDCPSSAVIKLFGDDTPCVLGRMAARVDRVPQPGEPHVIMSWLLGNEGRKIFSASAVYDGDEQLCAIARATWIRLATST